MTQHLRSEAIHEWICDVPDCGRSIKAGSDLPGGWALITGTNLMRHICPFCLHKMLRLEA